jgi:hypothetical protein
MQRIRAFGLVYPVKRDLTADEEDEESNSCPDELLLLFKLILASILTG